MKKDLNYHPPNHQPPTTISLNKEQVKDITNIACNVYAPLKGFLKKKDFQSVLENMRLNNGSVWPIPIILDVNEKKYHLLKKTNKIPLTDQFKNHLGFLENIEFYQYNKDKFAEKVFGTTNIKHPGVRDIFKMKKYLVGGKITLINQTKGVFKKYSFPPLETKKIFKQKGWKTIAGFQTRNVPHRGHEFLQKQVLKKTDGLFIQPVIGEKKLEDFKDEYIIAAYEILIEKYFPKNRLLLGILPLKMRYAGPREALLHALIRKNFGCTHFVVGRDHAGAKNFYPSFAAQKIFENFSEKEIGIKILKFPEVVYCRNKKKHTFKKNCKKENQIKFSGTKLRNLIKSGQKPPEYLMRHEIYNLLANSYNTLVDKKYNKNNNNKDGFVLWFTGLSQSGKTTIADKIYQFLKNKKIKTERLDGDIVRQSLTKDLGFTKEDRDENIRRVGFVAELLSKNEIAVVASFISPYKKERENLRNNVKNFIEIYVDTPLEVCEKRDKKGLYQQARQGKIKNFTGISDPYQEPQNPEIIVSPHQDPLQKSVKKIINYLEKNNLI